MTPTTAAQESGTSLRERLGALTGAVSDTLGTSGRQGAQTLGDSFRTLGTLYLVIGLGVVALFVLPALRR